MTHSHQGTCTVYWTLIYLQLQVLWSQSVEAHCDEKLLFSSISQRDESAYKDAVSLR